MVPARAPGRQTRARGSAAPWVLAVPLRRPAPYLGQHERLLKPHHGRGGAAVLEQPLAVLERLRGVAAGAAGCARCVHAC